jgi:hypothetical protein
MNGSEWDSTWPPSPRSTNGCVQNDLWACSTFSANYAPILHRDQQRLQMDRNEIPHDPRHLGVPSGASKTISEPMVRLTRTMHLSCVKINTISKWTKTSFQLSLITKEYHRVRPKWFMCLRYIQRKPCTYHASKRVEMRFHTTNVT